MLQSVIARAWRPLLAVLKSSDRLLRLFMALRPRRPPPLTCVAAAGQSVLTCARLQLPAESPKAQEPRKGDSNTTSSTLTRVATGSGLTLDSKSQSAGSAALSAAMSAAAAATSAAATSAAQSKPTEQVRWRALCLRNQLSLLC